MKKISVVTPSYNYGRFIERTISSVKNQNYPDYEHIIVDSSTDETIKIRDKYPEIRWLVQKERCLQSKGLNIGFRAAKGEIIAWINADDVFEPGAFLAASEYLEKHPETDMVYSDCKFIDENDKVIGDWHTTPFSSFRNLEYAQMIPQQTIFFRRGVFDKVGYIDEKYDYAMDYDFLIRVSKKCRIDYMPNLCFGALRLHSVSKTMGQRAKFEPEVMEIRKKHGARIPYPLVRLVQKTIGVFKKRL